MVFNLKKYIFHFKGERFTTEKLAKLIAVDPKGPPVSQLFVWVGGPRPLGARVVASPIFLPKVAQKSKIENKHHTFHKSIDRSLLSSHEKSQSIGLKWLSHGKTTYVQIWACVPYLAQNLANYAYF